MGRRLDPVREKGRRVSPSATPPPGKDSNRILPFDPETGVPTNATGQQHLRRNRIIRAAREALERQEYEQIQIRSIALDADVALGTLYRYFSSKEHLYATVLLEWAALDRSDEPLPTAEEQIRARVHSVIAAYARQPRFFKAHVILQSSPDTNAKAMLTAFAETAKGRLADDVVVLGPGAQDAATMLWALISSRLAHAIYRGGSMSDVHRLADRLVDLLAPQLQGEQASAVDQA
jgi:AcrR family transcriptional regulator